MQHGFVRAADGTITTFDPAGSYFTVVSTNSLNSNGDVSGGYLYLTSRGRRRAEAFIRGADGAIISYRYPRAHDTYGTGINADGAAAGTYRQTAKGTIYGYIRAP